MIHLERNIANRIIQQGKEELPIECCGLLAGQVTGSSIEILDIYSMTNIDHSPRHFSLDPMEQLAAYDAIETRGLQVLGHYHSHPAAPARPSREDIRLAYDPEAIYMILSLMEDLPVLKIFAIRDGQFTELPMTIYP